MEMRGLYYFGNTPFEGVTPPPNKDLPDIKIGRYFFTMIPVISERDLGLAGREWVEGSKIDGYPRVPKNIPPPPPPHPSFLKGGTGGNPGGGGIVGKKNKLFFFFFLFEVVFKT